jgi:hypothetical protein
MRVALLATASACLIVAGLRALTSDEASIDAIARQTHLRPPPSAAHGYLVAEGFSDTVLFARFEILPADLPALLEGLQPADQVVEGWIPGEFRTSMRSPRIWWRPLEARRGLGSPKTLIGFSGREFTPVAIAMPRHAGQYEGLGDPRGSPVYRWFLIDQTDPALYVVYVSIFCN